MASISPIQVYELLSQIPKGKVTTYGELARKLNVKAFRGVGQIVGENPNAPTVPCHRVVKSNGAISGYAFGVEKKIELLKSEGISVEDDKIVDFKQKIYKF
jgi:methylated-DNA-[protein]-cysteine S-methyltransferase